MLLATIVRLAIQICVFKVVKLNVQVRPVYTGYKQFRPVISSLHYYNKSLQKTHNEVTLYDKTSYYGEHR